ncbi:MAG: peptide MFS transporter [Bacteroidales bacterium]|nr:peptide MFS transporter [Bacteroidales bacterium]
MFKGHPKGLIAAALSNMGERFGYYIMNAVLLLFLCSKFGIADETAAIIYAVFYFAIYVLSLPGGIIADKLQNYKGTIQAGLLTMAAGYIVLSIPLMGFLENPSSKIGILVLTCVALLVIAFGNGLFKGNLQALVGQMYDNLEAEAAKKGPEALADAKSKRDPGFQIFYVFINIGGVLAPFVAPSLRSWWLGLKGMTYNADLPALCHQYLADPTAMTAEQLNNLNTLMNSVNQGGLNLADMHQACMSYIEVFNTGVHYSFLASVAAMLISLVIFLATKNGMPNPQKKAAAGANADNTEKEYSAEERAAMAKDIKQRMAGLYAVLGVCVFFWMAFHQNGQSLSLFARNFINSDQVAPEVWQFLNPALVILLTPVIMWLFGTNWGRKFSTPRKIALGMGFVVCAYLFLTLLCYAIGYPNGTDYLAQDVATRLPKSGAWVLIVTYFFLTVAELFISPLGLSFVSKIAPKHIQGICQGLWLSATAIGNLLIMVGPFLFNKMPKLWVCWLIFMIIALAAMCVMFGMLKWLEKITAEQPAAK